MKDEELRKAYDLLIETAYISNENVENMGFNEFKDKMK